LWQAIALLQSIVGYIPLADTVKAKEFRVMWIALNHHYFYGEVKLLLVQEGGNTPTVLQAESLAEQSH